MKLEAFIFGLCAAFLFVCGIVYGFVTDPIEPVGFAALLLSGGLCLFIGGYFWFISRRIDERPEDRADGEVIEGAGELGFFAPGSYYPIGLAAACTLTAIGVAFFYPWLIGVGSIAVLIAVVGLMFEFYTGQNTTGREH
ncbi:cytochrome c oxidase subunit 4 [Epidermidibacterium keratini]|uniref:Cytochrome c oxidase polypeptide 4 n=1 Tax=Epidermidibacterium keratini TaxID=1891644 RepID=A0A7L4YK27_9ACTN|nr:cytochrome c oxidase subunit 4 [Epidermidibacterium keratini]QHB99203.1 cytochrome c oxidase subunit 4 [Epidermidibacterium keratini]